TIAQNGEEVLYRLRQKRFDCVLLDIQMPIMDGFKTISLIRADSALAGMPVIAMTANASKEERERCLAAGMDDFIGKPFNPYALYTTIAHWLSARPQQRLSAPPSIAASKSVWAGDPSVIDLSVLAELVGDDKYKMRAFALKYMASARGDMKDIDAALARKDLAALGALGHHVSSPAGMIGAIGFANLCRDLERHGEVGGNIKQAREIISQMHTMLDQISESIDKDLA
ncbi:MAG: response regulator, partial [Methylococcaceae bacterium]|nr:response regulator [Methylococcaceae bacterium]